MIIDTSIFNRQAEIDQIELVLFIENEVVRLDISVNVALWVQVLQNLDHLDRDVGHGGLRETLFARFKFLIEAFLKASHDENIMVEAGNKFVRGRIERLLLELS